MSNGSAQRSRGARGARTAARDPLVRLDDVASGYRVHGQDVDVLVGATATFPSGMHAITGPSGSGKSTLLRAIAGLHPIRSGQITIHPGASSVTLVPQELALVPFLTAEENIALAADVRGIDDCDPDAVLRAVGLDAYATRLPGELSGGQRQRLALARGLACRARILLVDEPTASLDHATSVEIAGVLAEVAEQHSVVLLVATHDPAVVDRADQIHALESGRLVRTTGRRGP